VNSGPRLDGRIVIKSGLRAAVCHPGNVGDHQLDVFDVKNIVGIHLYILRAADAGIAADCSTAAAVRKADSPVRLSPAQEPAVPLNVWEVPNCARFPGEARSTSKESPVGVVEPVFPRLYFRLVQTPGLATARLRKSRSYFRSMAFAGCGPKNCCKERAQSVIHDRYFRRYNRPERKRGKIKKI